MKIEVDNNRQIVLKEVFNGIMLESGDKETFGICMRDSGFEFNYQGTWYSAQQGTVKQMRDIKECDLQNEKSTAILLDIKLENWYKDIRCSVRLWNGLKMLSHGNPGILLQNVKYSHFRKVHQIGSKTWREFEDLRGY